MIEMEKITVESGKCSVRRAIGCQQRDSEKC